MIVHKLPPPSPYRTIDTKKYAKSVAYFDSNSLNNLCTDMGIGEKMKHRGFDMWEGCLAGKRRDWADMKRYNKRDVDLLEKVYLRLRQWVQTKQGRSDGQTCPKCHSARIQFRGTCTSGLKIMRKIRCNQCTGWSMVSMPKQKVMHH